MQIWKIIQIMEKGMLIIFGKLSCELPMIKLIYFGSILPFPEHNWLKKI